jgi:hypothetical protein
LNIEGVNNDFRLSVSNMEPCHAAKRKNWSGNRQMAAPCNLVRLSPVARAKTFSMVTNQGGGAEVDSTPEGPL